MMWETIKHTLEPMHKTSFLFFCTLDELASLKRDPHNIRLLTSLFLSLWGMMLSLRAKSNFSAETSKEGGKKSDSIRLKNAEIFFLSGKGNMHKNSE